LSEQKQHILGKARLTLSASTSDMISLMSRPSSSLPQGLLELLDGDEAAVVLVEVLERGVEVLVPVHPVHVHRGGDELVVVDRPVPVRVGLHARAAVVGSKLCTRAWIDLYCATDVCVKRPG
jgi:hypothetical protein